MPPKKLPLKAGSKVIIKKGETPGIINRALGDKYWEVQVVDDAGNPKPGVTVNLKSQQIRNLTHDGEFPTQQDQHSVGNNSISTREDEARVNNPARNLDEDGQPTEFIEIVLNQTDHIIVQRHGDGTDSSSTSSGLSLLSSNIPSIGEQDPNQQVADQAIAEVEEMEHEEASEEGDPDDELDEDLPNPFHQHEEEGNDTDAFHASDFAAARGIEVDESRHKAKWDRYMMEKEALVANRSTVACKAPKKQSLGVGEKVAERGGQRRKGIIVADGRNHDDHDRNPVWTVLFEGSDQPEHNVRSTQLIVVKDTRIFIWTVVNDSTPRAAETVQKARTHGLAGFRFEHVFSTAEASAHATYQYPFLSLLIHLWPGKWERHLKNLNRAIEDVNEVHRRGGNKKKIISLVSGE
jgi:hypothetical protein